MRKPDYRWFHDKDENIQDLEGELRMKKKIVAMILVLACVTGIYAPENAWEAPVTAMPLSQLFEVLFDSSVVVKYPIF